MQKNIFLIGKIASGKTTISNYLSEIYGYKQYSFATELKKILQMIYPTIDKSIHRKQLQFLGNILRTDTNDIMQEDMNKLLDLMKKSEKFAKFIFNEFSMVFKLDYDDFDNLICKNDYFVQKLYQNQEFFDNYIEKKVVIDDMRFDVEFDFYGFNNHIRRYFVYIETNDSIRANRIVKRDFHNKNYNIHDIISQINSEDYIESLKRRCDLIISNDFESNSQDKIKENLKKIAVMIYNEAYNKN